MPAKSQIPWLLAALVLVASTHCVYSHAVEGSDWYHEMRMEKQPLDNERTTCENESACICKGATFAVVVEVPSPQLEFAALVDAESHAERFAATLEESRQSVDLAPAVVLSGANLRAHLQRFLL